VKEGELNEAVTALHARDRYATVALERLAGCPNRRSLGVREVFPPVRRPRYNRVCGQGVTG
jgi:hypothetical protein